MIKTASKERREFIRAKRVLCVQYRLSKSKSKGADQSWRVSTTHDMSVGGVAFFSEDEFHKGDTLELKIAMSGTIDIFTGFGEVLRSNRKKSAAHYLTAVKFLQESGRKRPAKSYSKRKK